MFSRTCRTLLSETTTTTLWRPLSASTPTLTSGGSGFPALPSTRGSSRANSRSCSDISPAHLAPSPLALPSLDLSPLPEGQYIPNPRRSLRLSQKPRVDYREESCESSV